MKVEQLITNPKKSIIGLSIPMILSLFLAMINNLADAMWVSGLGADALAAIGIVTPLFIIIIGLGIGLSAGVNSLTIVEIMVLQSPLLDQRSMLSIPHSLAAAITLLKAKYFWICQI